MKKVIYLSIMFLMISLTISAQEPGGQITRKRTAKVLSQTSVQTKKNNSKPRQQTRKTSKARSTTVQVEQKAPSYTSIQPIPISSLATYNDVVGAFSVLSNAQYLCQKLRDEGWGAQICIYYTYRVIMVGTNQESEAVSYINQARLTSFPGAYILKVENGRVVDR